MKPTREPSAIFGLRYLEEEDLEINDIIGCQTAAANSPPPLGLNSEPSFGNSFYTTACDTPDYDEYED